MASNGLGQGTFPYEIGTYPYRDNGETRINLNKELESFQKRGGLWTYVKAFVLEFNLVFAGNLSTETNLPGYELAKVLRAIYFNNWAHDIRLTGEFLLAFPWLNESRYWFADPPDIVAGTGDTLAVKVKIVLPFYDERLEDPRTLMDPVERYISLSAQMVVQTAAVDWFDGTMKINPSTSTFTLRAILEKTDKEWQAPPFTWRYEDRTGENPFYLNYNGVVHHHYLMQEPAKQTLLTPAFTDDNITIEPFEMSQPRTKILDFIENWEIQQKQLAAPDDDKSDAIAQRYCDSMSGVANVIPLFTRTEDLVLQHSSMPVISGQLKFTAEPSNETTHRSYIRYVAPNETKHEEEAKQTFKQPAAKVKRPNPGDRPQKLFTANTTRVVLGPQTMDSKDKVTATAKKVT